MRSPAPLPPSAGPARKTPAPPRRPSKARPAPAQAARPEGAGRYHTDTVAADILAMMHALSPAYLRAQVARLEMLAEAQAFVMRGEAPKPEEAPKPARKSRAKKK